MHVVICDDERSCVQAIREKVEQWAADKAAALTLQTCLSSEDLLDAWKNGLTIDMLFLDVQFPHELSGLEVAKQIFAKNEYIPIAFVTNNAEYACEGYHVNALRYIVKPVRQKDIDECMNIAWNRWNLALSESIQVKASACVIALPVKDIRMIESIGHQLHIHTISGGIIEARARLSDYARLLPDGLFGQCHKSYIVNIMYVRRIESSSLTLATREVVPIGRKYMQGFFSLFHAYHQGRARKYADDIEYAFPSEALHRAQCQ